MHYSHNKHTRTGDEQRITL